MSELSIGLIGAIAGAITGIVGAYVALRMLPTNVRVAKSEEVENISVALKNAVDTLLATSADRNKLELRVDELENHLEALSRESVAKIAELQTQVSEGEKRYNKLNDKYQKVVEFIYQMFESRGETIPPDLVLLLGDSGKFKWKGDKK